MSKWLITLAAVASLVGGCGRDERGSGLPPAQEWNTPVDPGSTGGSMSSDNPHGMDMDDPHAGLDMGNGMGADDPHAGLDMDDMDMGDIADTSGMEAPDPNRVIDPNSVLRGVIKASDAVKSLIEPDHVIFLSVKPYDPSTQGPVENSPPMAVAKIDRASVPVAFELSEHDAMIAGTRLTGDVVITAHVSTTHDASVKRPGEVIGMVRAKVPADKLELVLDTRIQ